MLYLRTQRSGKFGSFKMAPHNCTEIATLYNIFPVVQQLCNPLR